MSTDTSWMLWNAEPPKLPQPRPGEPLFTLVKDHRRTFCELRYHGEYGVEAQFLDDGELTFSRRFDLRAQAVQWAKMDRNALIAEGWTPEDGRPSDEA